MILVISVIDIENLKNFGIAKVCFSDEEMLNSDFDDSPEPRRKQYKNSLYNTQTTWKPTDKPDL